MTFSESVKKEFISETPRSTCCRRALCYGLLFDASFLSDGELSFDVAGDEFAKYFSLVLEKQFSKQVGDSEVVKAGRRYYRLALRLPSMAEKLGALSREGARIGDYVEFKCSSCRENFLRGIFLSRGTVSFSAGNDHLEYRIIHGERADALASFLTSCGVEPKRVERRGVTGLYYKRAELIEDNMNLMQAKDTYFSMMNGIIERDIRIRENRAVNCESVNIKKAVDTAQKQLKALKIIEKAGLLSKLEPSLYESALLRLENHDASMRELAELHDPPISKSKIFARFEKILDIADKISKRK